MIWAFSIYLEAVAILPQLFMLQKQGGAESLTSHYVMLLGLYRLCYLFNWIYRYGERPPRPLTHSTPFPRTPSRDLQSTDAVNGRVAPPPSRALNGRPAPPPPFPARWRADTVPPPRRSWCHTPCATPPTRGPTYCIHHTTTPPAAPPGSPASPTHRPPLTPARPATAPSACHRNAATEDNYLQIIVWVSGIVQTALYLDFFYNYINAKRERIDAAITLDP